MNATDEIGHYLSKHLQKPQKDNYLQLGSAQYTEFSKACKAKKSILVDDYKVPLTEHIVANIELLPIIEECFDIVLLSHSLEYYDEIGVLLEAYRVLKPNSMLVIVGFNDALGTNILQKISGRTSIAHSGKLIPIKKLRVNLDISGFKLLDLLYIKLKSGYASDIIRYKWFERMLSPLFGDVYVAIAKKEVTNLELLRNRNSIFSKKIISLPGDAAWD